MKFEHAKRCPVPGLLNCRDLGGHPIPSGRIRWGQFYRSAAPMLPMESKVLEDMGITLVIDLRSDFEHHKTLSFPASFEKSFKRVEDAAKYLARLQKRGIASDYLADDILGKDAHTVVTTVNSIEEFIFCI